uniref:Uncharacterized protein n=1 Tax=Anguilla anguilla TaxID=7936 RepID=A0A0E9UAY9_ANGAN
MLVSICQKIVKKQKKCMSGFTAFGL